MTGPSPRNASSLSLFELLRAGPLKVCILGSGNWGTAVAKLIAENTAESYIFDSEVEMWVYEGDVLNNIPLAAHINKEHENPKYLPDVKLPQNLVASTDLCGVAADADLIVVILPHQFVVRVAEQIKEVVKPTSRLISLVKGLHVENGVPITFTDVLRNILGIDCCALSGANVAKDVALEQFSESTIGYNDTDMAAVWQQLFDRPYFRVHTIPDVAGVQVCGALKNLIAVASGFCDGLKMGTNTKSALMRIGTEEMRIFATLFFSGILEETFFESSGFADVITTCFGGRNVRCAAEFIRRDCKASWDEIEADLLGGMKMQGQLTCKEVHEVIETFGLQKLFPLFNVTYQIAFENKAPSALLQVFSDRSVSAIKRLDECSPSPLTAQLGTIREHLQKELIQRKCSQ